MNFCLPLRHTSIVSLMSKYDKVEKTRTSYLRSLLSINIDTVQVMYDPFKLHIHNCFVNYLCQVCIKVTIINFTVTKSGLEDQILR